MRKMLLLVSVAAVLVACDNAQVSTNLETRKLTYSQDARTSLCFATIGRSDDQMGTRAASLSFTHVPCTPEVLALIRRGS